MNELDAAIDRIERQILGLQAQLTKLKEARDIAKGVLTGGYVAALDNQTPSKRKRAVNKVTIADIAAQILQQKGELHADEILAELKNFNMEPSKPTLVSGLLRDRDKRFILLGNNRYRLNNLSTSTHSSVTDSPSKSKHRIKMGGLTEETRKAINAFEGREFDIFAVIDQLKIQNPSLAEMIAGDRNKQASLSGTLKRLADDLKELEVVKRGRGSSPTIYKAKQAKDENSTDIIEEIASELFAQEGLLEKAS